ASESGLPPGFTRSSRARQGLGGCDTPPGSHEALRCPRVRPVEETGMASEAMPKIGRAMDAGASSDVPTPVADRIRERIRAAGDRFHANDNINEHIHEGELELLQAEVEAKVAELLRTLVIDVESDHNTQETARRVAKMYLREVFGG